MWFWFWKFLTNVNKNRSFWNFSHFYGSIFVNFVLYRDDEMIAARALSDSKVCEWDRAFPHPAPQAILSSRALSQLFTAYFNYVFMNLDCWNFSHVNFLTNFASNLSHDDNKQPRYRRLKKKRIIVSNYYKHFFKVLKMC